jgi:hypothetical protein
MIWNRMEVIEQDGRYGAGWKIWSTMDDMEHNG